MIKLNLIAQDEQEERILAYLQENASETLAGFTDYAYEEARKLARKNAKVMIIDDPTVYGWAIHYPRTRQSSIKSISSEKRSIKPYALDRLVPPLKAILSFHCEQ